MVSRYRGPFHHTAEDRLSRLDVALLARVSRGVTSAVGALADPAVPDG